MLIVELNNDIMQIKEGLLLLKTSVDCLITTVEAISKSMAEREFEENTIKEFEKYIGLTDERVAEEKERYISALERISQ